MPLDTATLAQPQLARLDPTTWYDRLRSLAIMRAQKAIFIGEVAQRTAGSVALLRSYLRLYTSIDVAKLASYSGLTPAEARAALASIKIKGGAGSLSFGGGGGAGDPSGLDALHFYLNGDIVEVEEYRPPTNAAHWFASTPPTPRAPRPSP